jgi:transcriptional regulator with XRE-family HTH domain
MDQEEKKRLIEKLKNKEYREAFAIEAIDTGVPFQIHALREQREWTQKELGDHANMAQETISRLEDPNYGKLTLKTLKRLASAFHVALMVRFIPFSELVEWELHLTADSLKALEFEKESYFQEEAREEFVEPQTKQEQPSFPSSVLIYLDSWKQRRQAGTPKTSINKIQRKEYPQEQNNYEAAIGQSGKVNLVL